MLTAYTTQPMRAVVHDRYGAPDVLRVEEIARPVPKDDAGDRVFGTSARFGTHARFICLRENARVARVPHTVGNVVLTLG